MEENAIVQLQNKVLGPAVVKMQEKFAVACQTAKSMSLQDNACAAFQAVCVVQQLREALSDEVMKAVFEPLMNTTIGFRTDKDPSRPGKNGVAPKPYDSSVIRDCLIDAISYGLMPTGNQFNIIAGRMYPTKEGYTALLKNIGCKYMISVGQDQQKPEAPFAEIPCKINYDMNGDKGGYTFIATVKKDSYSSADQLRGKAERRAKKSLYEYLTGCDLGDADEESSTPIAAANQGGVIALEPAQPQSQQQAMNMAAQNSEAAWRQAAKNNAEPAKGPGF